MGYSIFLLLQAGSETFNSITKSYYKGVAGVLIVFDMTHKKTFEHIQKWLNDVKESGNPISFLLIGNKNDMELHREVDKDEASNFAEENKMLYLETSAKTGENVVKAFETIAMDIYKKVENGIIDITSDNSGVKLGTEINSIKLSSYGQDSNNNKCCQFFYIIYFCSNHINLTAFND